MGELHSLTDWHVSEASDDAELDDFYGRNTNLAMLVILDNCVCVVLAVCLNALCVHVSVRCFYLASDVRGHGGRRLGVDICILGHKA